MSSFDWWLAGQTDRDDPTGDLARDARDDPIGVIGGGGPSPEHMQDPYAEDAYNEAVDEWGG